MAPKNKRRGPKQEAPVKTDCIFCKTGTEPDYRNYEDLQKFLSDRAKIIGKRRSGICSKHQRMLATAIKRARHLALLPFTPHL